MPHLELWCGQNAVDILELPSRYHRSTSLLRTGCHHGLCRGCPCTSSVATTQAMAVLESGLRSNFLCDILALQLSHECHTAQC